MASSSAARTNLTSNDVFITNNKLGDGTFRTCVAGTFIGGNRNNQEAACKRFKPHFRQFEDEYFAADFKIADKSIAWAEQWNEFCEVGKEILISRGTIHRSRSGIQYLVEPLIRNYRKWTSNSGWILEENSDGVHAMEAFTHYSYHASSGNLIVTDLQGRYKYNRFARSKSRFELSDPAICSRRRDYGPTDMGAKGIDSFFANHQCNDFCKPHWQTPRRVRQWFPRTSGTSMMSSLMTPQLNLQSRTTFRLGMDNIMEEESEEDSDDGVIGYCF